MTKNNLKVVKTAKDKDLENKEKNKALDAAIDQITDTFGKGSVMKLGQQKAMDVESVSTGSLSLDLALGIGGLPKGRIIEIYGPESSGKTTLALQVVAEAQKAGGICGFVDAEHALDPVYAKKLGVNTEELLISQPDTGEQALEITDTLIKSGSMSVLVVDSVAALTPRAEIEGDMGDHHVGLQARLMSQALRKLTGTVSRSGTAVLFINQIREKIGVVYGNPETTPGGRALKFYTSVRMEIRRVTTIKDGQGHARPQHFFRFRARRHPQVLTQRRRSRARRSSRSATARCTRRPSRRRSRHPAAAGSSRSRSPRAARPAAVIRSTLASWESLPAVSVDHC